MSFSLVEGVGGILNIDSIYLYFFFSKKILYADTEDPSSAVSLRKILHFPSLVLVQPRKTSRHD